MFCPKCGTELEEDSVFCTNCGYNVKEDPDKLVGNEAEVAPKVSEEQTDDAAVSEKTSEVSEEVKAGDSADDSVNETSNQTESKKVDEAVVASQDSDKTKKEKKSIKAIFKKKEKTEAATEATKESNPEDKKKKKNIIVGAVVVVAAVAIIAVVISAVTKSGKLSCTMSADGYSDMKVATASGKTTTIEDVYTTPIVCEDGSKIVYQIIDDKVYELYYIDNRLESVKFAESSKAMSVCSVSSDGRYIYYFIADPKMEEYGIMDMFLLDLKSGKNEKVSEDVVCRYVITSPDKKSVSFLKCTDFDEETFDYFTYVAGGSLEKLFNDTDKIPMFMSNNAKRLVYYDYEKERMYYLQNGESYKISVIDDCDEVYANKDVSEFLFTNEGKTYLYQIGKEDCTKISNSRIYVEDNLLPFNSNNDYQYYYLDTFKGRIYCTTDDALVWFNKKGTDSETIAKDINGALITNDGRSVIYMDKRDRLFTLMNVSGKLEPTQLECSFEVEDVAVSNDLKNIYLASEDYELYYVKKADEFVRITNNLDEYTEIEFADNDGKVYFIENGDLYCATTNAKSKQRVKSDIEQLWKSGSIVYCQLDDEIFNVEEFK